MSSPHKTAAGEGSRERKESRSEADPARRRSRVPAPSSEKSGRFDKAFPVWLDGERGVMSGVGRNITETGMFVETREPLPLGSRVRVTFAGPSSPTELTLEAEVRYQCFINFSKDGGARAGMRGMGLRFVPGQKPGERKGTLH